LIKSKATLFDPPFYVEKEIDSMIVEISVQYTEEFNETVLAFANNIFNPEGGMHITGFRSALTRVLNSYAQSNKLIKDSETLSGDDVREGMTAVISVKLSDPQFEGQTKAKLGNPEVRGAVETVFGDYFASYLEEHPTEARKILNKVFLAAKARLAARAARDTVIRKGMLDGLSLPGKLTDCIEKDAAKSELFIVEGDSAGGNAKQGRDRHFQAILPLRGKILNVERARLDKMLANNEIKALVIALGAGIGTEFEVERMRYHRIVIMTDADVDGAHIRTLLLTFFFRYMAPAIEKGYIYIAQPPLYRVKYGNVMQYAYSDEEKDKLVEIARTTAKTNPDIQRYKGLGEMNADQLWETTMNPEHRILLQVKIDDLEEIDQIMHTLMGDEVAPRKRFIQTHAKTVKNLDV
jgi:DNA gyrase subunit B